VDNAVDLRQSLNLRVHLFTWINRLPNEPQKYHAASDDSLEPMESE
jgi:plasmid replication initiation protein